MNLLVSKSFALSGALCLLSGFALADDQTQALIDRARSAAPAMVSAEAAVMYQGKVLEQGGNGWVCMPETLPGDGSPICNDATWMAMMQAVGEKADFKADKLGFSYMLQGDAGVSNSDPYHPDHANADDFIKEGPHLMLIAPPELLSGLTDDPHAGGPYVMWKDTPYAHVMIPLGARD